MSSCARPWRGWPESSGRAVLAAPCRADHPARSAAGRRCKRPSRVAPRPLEGGVGGRQCKASPALSRMDRFPTGAVTRWTGSGRHHDATEDAQVGSWLFARPRSLVVASRHGGTVVSVDAADSRMVGRPAFNRSADLGPVASLNDRWSGRSLRRTVGCLAVLRFWCLTSACS